MLLVRNASGSPAIHPALDDVPMSATRLHLVKAAVLYTQALCMGLGVFTLAVAPARQAGAQAVRGVNAEATLAGTVLTETTERPLMNAVITIAKLGINARTDSAGNFSVGGIIPGEYAVAIKLAGFESLFTTITFTSGQKVEADFLLKDRVIQFAPKAERERLNGSAVIGQDVFDERSKTGLGKYVGQDKLVASNEITTAEMIRGKVSALHSNSIQKGEAALASRAEQKGDEYQLRGDANDRKAGAKPDCYVQVMLNGSPMYRSVQDTKLFDVNSIPARMLLTAEYYPANDTPAMYRSAGSQCGTLVVWTRGR